ARADQHPGAAQGAAAGERLLPLFLGCLLPAAILAILGYIVAGGLDDVLPTWLGFLSLHDWLPRDVNPLTLGFMTACLPVIVFYLRVWRSVPDVTDRGRVAALLAIAIIVIVFWTTYGLNTTALNVWTRDDTNRRLPSLVKEFTDRHAEFEI